MKVKCYCSRTQEYVITVENLGIAQMSLLQGRTVVRADEKTQDFKANMLPAE
jgi:hypothetical protein